MLDFDNITDLIIDNIKKLFFPEEWIELDMRFSKFELFTMLFLERKKEATMTELVEYINCPMSTATGMVDRLVKNRYMLRERSETDRRIVVLRLTDEGSQLITKLKATILGYINVLLEELTGEEKQLIADIAMRLMSKLQRKLSSEADVKAEGSNIKSINIE